MLATLFSWKKVLRWSQSEFNYAFVHTLTDPICPATQIRANHRLYRGSKARTDLLEFEGMTHWIIAQDGWQRVAGAIQEWLKYNL